MFVLYSWFLFCYNININIIIMAIIVIISRVELLTVHKIVDLSRIFLLFFGQISATYCMEAIIGGSWRAQLLIKFAWREFSDYAAIFSFLRPF